MNKFLMVLFLILLSLSIPFSQILAKSQSSSTTLPILVNLIEFSQEGIINNIIYYIGIQGSGSIIYLFNESTLKLENLSVSSTLYASILTDPTTSGVPLELKGVIMLPPKAINDTVYFAYAPGVTVLKDLNPKTVVLGYAKFSSTSGWGNVVNVTSSGVVRSFDVFGNKVYAVVVSNDNRTHILIIQNNNVVKDMQVGISNPFQIVAINDNLALISNSTAVSYFSYVFNTSVSPPTLHFNYFIVNLSSGKIIKINNYNNLAPYLVYPVNGSIIAVVYQDVATSFTSNSFIVLYDLQKNMSIINVKLFSKTSIYQIIANDGYIVVARMQLLPQYQSYKLLIETYNSSLTLLSTLSFATSFFPEFDLPVPVAIIENHSSIIVVTNTYSMTVSQTSIYMISTIDMQEIGSKPLPFNIYVNQINGNGYTLLNITWDRNDDCTYRVYINGTLVETTKSTNFVYNATQNGTYLVKVVAVNSFGSIEKEESIKVVVSPLSTGIQTTTLTTTSTSTKTTTPTTQITSITNITTTQTQQQATASQSSQGPPLLPIIAGVIVVVVVVMVIILILRRR